MRKYSFFAAKLLSRQPYQISVESAMLIASRSASQTLKYKVSNQRKAYMKIQSSVLVHLGFGKYVRSDQVTAVIPIEEERGPGRRTFVHVQGQTDPVVASRAEDTIIRDLVQEPREVTQSRQQQEILQDLLTDLSNVNTTVRRISRDEGGLDLERLERRIRQVMEA